MHYRDLAARSLRLATRLRAIAHNPQQSLIRGCWHSQRYCTAQEGNKQLLAACVLERLPVVVPDDPLFEVQYHLLKEHLFSKYRRPLPDEFSSKSGGVDFLPGSDGSETAAFTPAPRITEADEQNDTRSLRRALDKRLFFLVKSKGGGGEGQWHFPLGPHQPGQEIRKAAETALADTLTEDESRLVYFVGHSPAGHATYPDALLFFHRAQLIKGTAALRDSGGSYDFAWITKEELPQYIDDEELQKLLEIMLPGP